MVQANQFTDRRFQYGAPRQNHGALNEVLQFPDVAWPRVAHHAFHGCLWNGFDLPVELLRVLVGVVPDQMRNVLGPVAQSRNGDREDVQPIIEILPEFTFCNHLSEIAMRGCYQPHIGLDRPRAAQTLEFPLLEHAQQLGLQLHRHVSYFVQKQRPLVRQFKAAQALRRGAREGPSLMTEEFALEQAEWNRGAAYLYKNMLASRAVVVYDSRDDFLPSARVPLNE